jgi:hypothetical protein
MKTAANVCGVVSFVVSLPYGACITLPPPCWPFVCIWGRSEAAFLRIMLAGIVLGVIATWKGSPWWIAAVVFGVSSLFMGGSTV